jgi:hypothetical protein
MNLGSKSHHWVDSVNGGQQAEDANEEADGAASNSEREGEKVARKKRNLVVQNQKQGI